MGDRHDAELAQAALCTAIAVRGGDVAGVIFHTDQGGEYTGEPFRQAGAAAGITQSMGRTGSALDNALRGLPLHPAVRTARRPAPFATRAQARAAVAGCLDEYNTQRRHSTCGMLPPVAYEHRRTAA